MKLFTSLFYLLITVAIAVFFSQNSRPVHLQLYFNHYQCSLAFLLAVSLITGLILGYLLNLGRYWRLKREYRRLQKKSNSLSQL